MNRTGNSFKAGLVSLLMGFSACSKPLITEAETYFHNFPKTLEGAREIYSYETPGAKHCLVHIKDMHALLNFPPLNQKNQQSPLRKSGRDLMSAVCNVQVDVYKILIDLQEKSGIKSVRVEGVGRDFDSKDCLKTMGQRMHYFVNLGYAFQDEFLNGLYEHVYGASFSLGAQGTLSVKAAESLDFYSRSMKLENGKLVFRSN